ncbi:MULTISPECIES: coiled-coil domain-containing protein [Cysteiniphilum]|uniref:coiled-coil domain-containing protein n=1 Tax=Cysteiniphilum TaxID=2056696 RepID=UPI00177D55D9|nr:MULTISPECIES: hypothetical protein [Cysteiniphilum]
MNDEVKVTITQDKLVDILMHAATREDIANVKTEISGLGDKLDKDIANVRTEISGLRDKLDKDIASVNNQINKLDNRIDKLDNRIDKLDSRIDSNFKWMMGAIIIAILIPLVSKFIPVLH